MSFLIRFHWSPCTNQDSADPARFVDLCRWAEMMGVESVHVPMATDLRRALELAVVAGAETKHVRFRIGWDSNGVLASLLGQELKNAWATLRGRLVIHMRFDSDDAVPNGHFARAGEFLANCRRIFPESDSPEFDVEGETAEVAFLAIKHADCLWRIPSRPNQVYADALPVLHFGKQVGLLTSVIARETRQEALKNAAMLLPSNAVEHLDDLTSWITPYLWTGVAAENVKTAALVGSFEEVACALHDLKQNGISQFLIRAWPTEEEAADQEMASFGTRVLPIIREIECRSMAAG